MSGHTAKRRRLSPSPEDISSNSSANRSHNKSSSHSSKHADISTSGAMAKQVKNARSAEVALANGFYKSSFFKLQMDELLSESRPNYDKQLAKLKDVLHNLKDTIERIPERSPKLPLDAGKELQNLHSIFVPYPDPRPGRDTKYSVAYSSPTNINVVGSFALRTGARSGELSTIDMAVTMPSSIFQEKDYTNYRYFHKRAYYIACIAAGIKDAGELSLDVKFGLQDGDGLRPIIMVQPKGAAFSRYQIRIITAIEDCLFPISRTLPMKNNIRHGSKEGTDSQEPTPLYNSSLRSEATVSLYHKLLSMAAQSCESFRDACLLGRIWLRQRGFGSTFQTGGFGSFEWAVLMSLLFEGGGPNGKQVLLKSYSSYQLFKATLQYLAGKNFMDTVSFFAPEVSFPRGTPVVYDGKRGLNVIYKMTPWSYAFLRHEANTTLKMLNESRDDNFERVFIFKVNEPLLRFDRLVTLPVAENGDALGAIRNEHAVYEVLVKALGDRADLIHIVSDSITSWSAEVKQPHRKAGRRSLTVGLLLNSENATRVVDHGPAAEEKEEAASFRSFWGEKAELRRFKDGSIRESLVWSDQLSSSIVHQILMYILKRHFNYVESDIGYIGDEFDRQLHRNGDGILSYSSPSFQLLTDAFNSLEKSIQDMDGVPLTVRQLAPASSLLRYTALHVNKTPSGPRDPVDVILRFESSARWPDDLVAIQMTKVAFLVKMGDALTESSEFSSGMVGLENEQSKILNNAFLDIIHVSGVVFRIRIHHDREQTLLERRVKESGLNPQTKQEIAYALAAYKRVFIHSPRLTQAIRTLCTRLPLLSPTIRLVKYWFSCHLFDGHVNEELIELMVVRVFTQPYPWETPSSIMVGFLRTLHFLSRWEWQQEPMVLDLGGELDQNAIETIRTRFSAWRSIDPAMNSVSMFVGSDIDPDGVTWTQYEFPSKVVAARICTLAKAVMKLVREQGSTLDVPQIFLPSLEPYDFVIRLHSKLLHDRSASLAKYKNLGEQDDRTRAGKLTVIKSFVHDLQACFSPNILFFYGNEQSDIVAGLWNPQALKPKSWSLGMTYSTLPGSEDGEDNKVVINRTAMLNEISRLGTGMVTGIDVCN
ncbi:hypothetical protein P175DRAFT_0505341 [Aspergillus ochraceoroseus IBT 24754]|uniref:U3 small nucleolar RNA-associated protein 22 n=3 Tax=Aspergillus subgen. Nidulantes TaxID=2720870 RepID=A0A0F8WWG5_9EURO|nr:uncharacterized protein P175DRAFT_0505341 [Aspergillus ochraceoroseus IBT 24754]KKK15657.1 hypothetical protein ARAM_000660 [Aspergillus rambellii]KKK17210.1 hypothetical protein AOCH_000730 [Aspergillus ochraceoroseus]PTU16935.1 hypothetical protein P175DRAFT_0505341 [Aspergillus ochraceoroseus IBT 24754]